jgi:MFS family permease
MLVPGNLALISSNFPQERRGRAIGTCSGFTSITAAIGPVACWPHLPLVESSFR